jgi:hypothetical protein
MVPYLDDVGGLGTDDWLDIHHRLVLGRKFDPYRFIRL